MKMMIRKLCELPAKVYNLMLMRYLGVSYGENCTFKGKILIQGKHNIEMGDNVRIKSGLHYNPIGGDNQCVLVARPGGRIIIGSNVGMSNSAIVSFSEVKIGDNVLLGGGVKIYDTDFHSLDYEKRMAGFEDVKTAPVCIKNGAFIGAHSIILKGVTIGEYSVVGAGAVVTRSIPPCQAWAGNPARFIKNIEKMER